MYISFFRIFKFRFLAQFPIDHIPYPVVSTCILSLHEFAVFAFYVIDHFISITNITYNCYFVASYLLIPWYWLVLKALFYAVIRRDSISLLKVSFSYPCPSLLESLEVSSYFSFLVISCLICFVPDGYNQSFSTLNYVIFESLYRFINAILNAGKSSSSFFSWQIQSVSVVT